MRRLYEFLLSLHPPAFRQRFSAEMLEAFDAEGGSWRLLGDVAASVLRQRLLRPEFDEPAMAFAPIEIVQPTATILLRGALVSAVLFTAAALSMNGGGGARRFMIGVHYPTKSLLPLDRRSFQEAGGDTEVRLESKPDDPWRAAAEQYFKIIRVLRALDGDQDLTISHVELVTALPALRRLDGDRDGRLSAEECGFQGNQARLAFMAFHPVLGALDSDHDGQISASEMQASPLSLQKLDRNGDGSLSPWEVMPDDVANQAALILSRGDGSVELIKGADRNHDGVTTVDELAQELRFRQERQKQLDAARTR
jgi:hypothetical protein